MPGIDNAKFQPIVREHPVITIDLPLSKIKPISPKVNKMLKDLFRTHQAVADKQSHIEKQIQSI